MATQPGPQTRPASTQSQTITSSEQAAAPPAPILRLRGAHTSRRRVQWTEDVVDNEKLNRKKSKVCCIYHRPKRVDESSDESSSSSDSDSDSEGGSPKDHHGDGCPGHNHRHRHGGRPRRRGPDDEKKDRRPSPNAYERVPKVKGRPATGSGGSESKSKA